MIGGIVSVLVISFQMIGSVEIAGGIIAGLLTFLSTLILYLIKRLNGMIHETRKRVRNVDNRLVRKEFCEERSRNMGEKIDNVDKKLDDIKTTIDYIEREVNDD